MMARLLCLAILVIVASSVAGCDALVSSEQRLANAREALAAGDFGWASIELRKVVGKEANNPEARFLLAKLAFRTGDAASARRELERAIASGATGPEVDAMQVEVLLGTNSAQSLLAMLDAGQLDLADRARSVARGRAQLALGRWFEAASSFDEVLRADPAAVDALLGIAEVMAAQAQSDRALAELAKAQRADPRAWGPYLLQADLLMRRGQYGDAENALRLANERVGPDTSLPDRAHIYAGLIDSCLAQGQVERAAAWHMDLARMLPGGTLTELLGARIHLAEGNYRLGTAELQRVVTAMPSFLSARMLLGAAQLAQGNLLQAESQLALVVQAAPDNLEARKLLAKARLQLDEPGAAIRALIPATERNAADSELYLLLSQAQFDAGHPGAAIDALERRLQIAPDDANARLDLAQALLAAGLAQESIKTLEEARPEPVAGRRDALLIAAVTAVYGPQAGRDRVDRMLTERPRDVATLNLGALYLASQGEPERARSLLRQALEVDHDSTVTYLNLARIDAAKGDLVKAEASVRRVFELAPDRNDVRAALAELMARRGARDEAVTLLAEADPDRASPEILFAMARIRFQQNQDGKGVALVERATKLRPEDPELASTAGMLLLDSLQFNAALAQFRRATELSPDAAIYWLNSARAQLAMNQTAAARESIEWSLKLHPDWVPAIGALVLMDLRAKRFDDALDRVDALLRRQPNDSAVQVLRADVLMAVGRQREAARSYESAMTARPDATTAVKLFQARLAGGLPRPAESLDKWLALQPGDVRVRRVLAEFYLSNSRFQQAAVEFEAISQLAPGDAVAFNNLAWVYQELGDPRALGVAERAFGLAPGAPAVADTLGWILVRNGDVGRGLGLLQTASRSEPPNAEWLYHYGAALAAAGRRDEARQVLERTMKLDQDFPGRADAASLMAELGQAG